MLKVSAAQLIYKTRKNQCININGNLSERLNLNFWKCKISPG